jgi:hypothetical protein
LSRPSIRSSSRLRVLVAGIVLGATALSGTTAAHATADVVDNEATILRIGGSAVTGSNAIPSGRSLTPVRLTTSDPATTEGDGTSLLGAVAGFRIGRTTVPGKAAEQVTFRINGTTVATSVPDMRGTQLQTDAGPLSAVVFTANGVTYAIPRSTIGAATRTVATSAVNTGTVGFLSTHEYGLLPVGGQPRVGTVFTQSTIDGTPSSSGTERHTVVDADGIRRNAGAVAEELVFLGEPATRYTNRVGTQGLEVLATVSLRNGATVDVRGLRFDSELVYGSGRTTWLFERAALAAAGATIADVTGVVSVAPSAHTLTWQELGFDLA